MAGLTVKRSASTTHNFVVLLSPSKQISSSLFKLAVCHPPPTHLGVLSYSNAVCETVVFRRG
jgi:hypothetical protein